MAGCPMQQHHHALRERALPVAAQAYLSDDEDGGELDDAHALTFLDAVFAAEQNTAAEGAGADAATLDYALLASMSERQQERYLMQHTGRDGAAPRALGVGEHC